MPTKLKLNIQVITQSKVCAKFLVVIFLTSCWGSHLWLCTFCL